MKYSIEGFSQEKLVEQGLDCRDAVFLRWFVDFQATNQMKIHVEDSSVYHWIDHATVIHELPILGRSTPDSVGKYIKQLIDKGVLEKHLVRRGQDKGTEVYYRIVPALIYECTSSEEEHRNDRAGTTPAQICGSDSSTTIIQQEEGEETEFSPDISQKQEDVYQLLVDAALVYGKLLSLSRQDKKRIQTAVEVWTATVVCEAWTEWLELGEKLSIRFFCEDTNFAKYRISRAVMEPAHTCPRCGRAARPWEVSETDCIHCADAATSEQAEEILEKLRRELCTREVVS